MELNINDEIKIRILKQLSDRKVYSFYSLAKTVKANNTTVKKNCAFLHTIGLIMIDEVSPEESASGTPSYRVTITEDGSKAVGLVR
jgi:predicted transcriptional regulator